jgi:hypothetical protein
MAVNGPCWVVGCETAADLLSPSRVVRRSPLPTPFLLIHDCHRRPLPSHLQSQPAATLRGRCYLHNNPQRQFLTGRVPPIPTIIMAFNNLFDDVRRCVGVTYA